MNDIYYAHTNFIKFTHTIKNVNRDFKEWHMGRSSYAFWAINLDTPEVRKLLSSANQHFAGLLLENYLRKPHITICVCGFLSDKIELADDYGARSFEAQVSKINKLNLKPFEIEIHTLASFSSAPFFHIKDSSNSIATLNKCLTLDIFRDNQDKYIPHVTIGLYAEAWPSNHICLKLDSFTKINALCCSVSKISLMSYKPAEIGGELSTVADYHLEKAEIQWYETPPLSSTCLA